jgi:hypothetical protein
MVYLNAVLSPEKVLFAHGDMEILNRKEKAVMRKSRYEGYLMQHLNGAASMYMKRLVDLLHSLSYFPDLPKTRQVAGHAFPYIQSG